MFMSYSGIKDHAAKNGNHGLLMEGCGLTDTLLKTCVLKGELCAPHKQQASMWNPGIFKSDKSET